jgi:EmrB/QacA subfamily drug resistance transporter
MVVLSLGVSLIVVDATVVNVLLPQMIDGLGLHSGDAEWINSVYALVLAALLIPFGRAGDIAGRRRMFLLGTVIFLAASVLAATAQAGPALIAARALQGAGGAMIMPATLSTVHAVFTGRDRAIAFGIWGSLIGGMAALGPLLGGAVATSLSWRWAFGINVPLGLLLIAGALAWMPETRQPAGVRGVDWLGGALTALGLGALVCGLIEGPVYGWWRPLRDYHLAPSSLSPVPIVLALGVVLLTALVFVERARARANRPVMLDLRLYRIRSFRRGNLTAALISVGELGLLFVLPLFLVGVHGDSPFQISLAILPLALGAFVAGPYAGRLANRCGAPRVVQLGMALEVIAVLGIALTLTADTGGWGLAPWMLLYGVGLGLTSAQLANVTLSEVPAADAGQASGAQSTARQVGAALGIALIGTVFVTSLGQAMADRLRETGLPAHERAAITHELRQSAGTYARDLSGAQARAAAESLATAAGRGALATAAILALGLAMSLRLRPAEESTPMIDNTTPQAGR